MPPILDSSVRLDIDLSKIKEKGTITFIVKGRAVPWQCGPRLWLIRNLHTEQERGKRTANSSCRCHLRPLLWESPTGKRQQLDLSVKKPSPTPLTPSAPPLCPQQQSSTPLPHPRPHQHHFLLRVETTLCILNLMVSHSLNLGLTRTVSEKQPRLTFMGRREKACRRAQSYMDFLYWHLWC